MTSYLKLCFTIIVEVWRWLEFFFNQSILEQLNEKINIIHKKHLINERYTCGKISAHGIQIRGEVGVDVVFLETGDWIKRLDQVLNSNIHLNIYNPCILVWRYFFGKSRLRSFRLFSRYFI